MSVSEVVKGGFRGWWGCGSALFYSNGACTIGVDSLSHIHISSLTHPNLVPKLVHFTESPLPPANTYTPKLLLIYLQSTLGVSDVMGTV